MFDTGLALLPGNHRQKRTELGLTLEALGHLAEMDSTHIAKVEKG